MTEPRLIDNAGLSIGHPEARILAEQLLEGLLPVLRDSRVCKIRAHFVESLLKEPRPKEVG